MKYFKHQNINKINLACCLTYFILLSIYFLLDNLNVTLKDAVVKETKTTNIKKTNLLEFEIVSSDEKFYLEFDTSVFDQIEYLKIKKGDRVLFLINKSNSINKIVNLTNNHGLSSFYFTFYKSYWISLSFIMFIYFTNIIFLSKMSKKISQIKPEKVKKTNKLKDAIVFLIVFSTVLYLIIFTGKNLVKHQNYLQNFAIYKYIILNWMILLVPFFIVFSFVYSKKFKKKDVN